MSTNLKVLNNNELLDSGPIALDFKIIDTILVHRFQNITSFAFYHGFSIAQTKKEFRDLVCMLFENQKVTKDNKLVFPHNLYMQFILMLNQDGGLDHILKHFVEFGMVYKNSCIHGDEIGVRNINNKIDEARRLLELHGYLVFNQFNCSI